MTQERIEYQVIVRKRNRDGDGKWHQVESSPVFDRSTMDNYDGIDIAVAMERYEDRIKRDLNGVWP